MRIINKEIPIGNESVVKTCNRNHNNSKVNTIINILYLIVVSYKIPLSFLSGEDNFEIIRGVSNQPIMMSTLKFPWQLIMFLLTMSFDGFCKINFSLFKTVLELNLMSPIIAISNSFSQKTLITFTYSNPTSGEIRISNSFPHSRILQTVRFTILVQIVGICYEIDEIFYFSLRYVPRYHGMHPEKELQVTGIFQIDFHDDHVKMIQ